MTGVKLASLLPFFAALEASGVFFPKLLPGVPYELTPFSGARLLPATWPASLSLPVMVIFCKGADFQFELCCFGRN